MKIKNFIIAAALTIVLPTQAILAETVVFNTHTLKFHSTNYRYVKKCTKNCIKIDKQKAISKGGKPCKVCGG